MEIKGLKLKEEIRRNYPNQQVAADKLGVSRQTLSTWFRLGNLDKEILQNVKTKLGIEIGETNVVNPKNSTFKEDLQQYHAAEKIAEGKEELGPSESDHSKTLTNQKKVMPMYDTVTNASSLEVYNDINKEEPAFYVDIPQFKDCKFGKKIFGQSMKGSYCSGSYVFCREVFDHSIILFGEVYYLETEDYCMVKRLQKGSKEDCILACSDNEECRKDGSLIYQPIEIQKDKIRKLYIVKGAFIQTQH